jgi:chromosome segregation protein
MRVEKIEIAGFKSFGDRITFDLHSGITCIVGPNGCGKSNVVDAFKWVLGEQSVKSLRGGKMEEIIFAGTTTKKPRGMSEVSLYVSGLGSSDNGKDNVTVVTRRLYRSGDSDYMLNRQSCRLRDIRDIFLDTGLELKSYSMLEQDRVSSILTAKPEERRFLIEEVAGVVKYKVRRHEAKNKLESSRNNLARINDIIGEVGRQLKGLDRQARKAERYKKFMEELKDIELRIARGRFEELTTTLNTLEEEYRLSKESDAGIRAELSKIETDIESRRISLTEDEKQLDSLQGDLQERQRAVANQEQDIAVFRTDLDHKKENIIRLGTQGQENERKRAESQSRREELSLQVSRLEEDMGTLSAKKDAQDTGLKEQEESIRERDRVLDARRRESFRITDETGSLKNDLHKFAATHDNLGRKHNDLTQESRSIAETLTALETSRTELQNAMLARNNELLLIREQKEAVEKEAKDLKEKLENLRAAIAEAREDMASLNSRLESLKEMDVAESSVEVLREGVEVLAPVSDSIEVPKEYERAIESVLREVVEGFIVKGYGEIKQAIGVINSKELKRTAFVPEEEAANKTESPLPAGAIAFASDLVKPRNSHGDAVCRMLKGVVVVRDLDTALSLAGKGMTVVTTSGELVEPSGAVIAGKSRGVLALKRQIREIESDLGIKKSKVESLGTQIEGTQSALVEKEESLKRLSERVINEEKELSLLRLKAERNSEEAERAGRKQSQIRLEMQGVLREKESLGTLMEEKKAEIGKLENGKTEIEDSIVSMQAEIARIREEYETRRTESVELGLELTTIKERLNSLRSEDASTENLLNELLEKDELIKNEIASTKERLVVIEQEIGSKEEALRSLVVLASEVASRISDTRDVIEGKAEELRTTEQGLRGLRVRIDDSAHKLSELEVKRTEIRMKLENLTEGIQNTYEIELGTLPLQEVSEEDMERLPELKQKLDSIGPVSLGSIEEYDELKERHEFLSKQQEDLNLSIAELEEAISRINSTTKKRLRDAYDQLKVKFSEVFIDLFGGGRAELILTDESNILESGLDVIAQPPGKRLQNISLLSGGEKTLTALALVFAGFLIKPTPLCILDEADAALDDSNTQKFAELLQRLSGEIQFIVVTHNRVTMEAADYLYGITMEEPGNSKAISMELKDA